MNLDNCLKRHYNRYRGVAYLNLYYPKILNVKNKLEPIITFRKKRVAYNKLFYKPFQRIMPGTYIKKKEIILVHLPIEKKEIKKT